VSIAIIQELDLSKLIKKIPDIKDVKIIHHGEGLQIQFGNHTHFVDKRDLFYLPSWNDRKDNRDETLRKIRSRTKND